MAAAQADSRLPDGPGKALVERSCRQCHTLNGIVRGRNSKTGWAKIVHEMVSKGATTTDDEADEMIAYLAKNFGKDKPLEPEAKVISTATVNVNKATASEIAAALDIEKDTAYAIV